MNTQAPSVIVGTIISQLGGSHFSIMTGAKDFMATENGLQFSLPNRFANDSINRVRVELTPQDFYTMTFYQVTRHGMAIKRIKEVTDLYHDQLQQAFTAATGLDCHL